MLASDELGQVAHELEHDDVGRAEAAFERTHVGEARRPPDRGRELGLDPRASGRLRLDNGRIGRIDEDCALHVAPVHPAARRARPQSMIPKSGYRFPEKIMLQEVPRERRESR